MLKTYPNSAATRFGEVLRDAIIEKGRRYVHDLDERVTQKIKKEELEVENDHAEFQHKKDLLDKAIQTLEEMKTIMAEG